ncbi:MAG TPA: SDR family oxidoreductase [Flavobacterium sp.]|nr:SDR family oxidoreductase [Flavobacterium sp.]
MKTILITGTSRGIGLELCQILAQDSSNQVISLSRQISDKLQQLPNVHCYSVDLTQPESIRSVSAIIQEKYPQINIVIHNAGAIVNKPFTEITAQEFEHVYKVNVFGVVALNQAILPQMSRGGHVVTISSMGGIQGSMKFPGLSAYSSSKGAVITLSELLAEEYKEQGVAFNVLALGAVQTEMLEEAFPGYQAPLNPKNMAQYIADFALNGNKYFNGKVLQVSSTTP